MTVPVADNKVTMECNGVQTAFSFSIKYLNNSDIKVYIVNADKSLTLQTEGLHYTLSSTDKNVGGIVTLLSVPADDKQLFIIRVINLDQSVPFKPNTNFPEQIIEDSLDKLTMICQQLLEQIKRSLLLPANTILSDLALPTPQAGKTLKWNDTEDGLGNSDTSIDDIQASLDAAAASATAAANSASIAQAATGVVPSPVALNYLRQKSDLSGLGYRTPAEVKNDINASAPYLATCSTAAATAEKAVTLSGVTLSDGLTLLVGFTNANTASSITINLNAGTAHDLVDKRGNTPVFSNKAGEKVLITYDATSSKWILVSAEFYSAKMSVPSNSYIAITLGASGSTYTAPADGKMLLAVAGGESYSSFACLVNGRNNDRDMNGAFNYGPVSTASLDVLKGDVITYTYVLSALDRFRFYYYEGSKP